MVSSITFVDTKVAPKRIEVACEWGRNQGDGLKAKTLTNSTTRFSSYTVTVGVSFSILLSNTFEKDNEKTTLQVEKEREAGGNAHEGSNKPLEFMRPCKNQQALQTSAGVANMRADISKKQKYLWNNNQ